MDPNMVQKEMMVMVARVGRNLALLIYSLCYCAPLVCWRMLVSVFYLYFYVPACVLRITGGKGGKGQPQTAPRGTVGQGVPPRPPGPGIVAQYTPRPKLRPTSPGADVPGPSAIAAPPTGHWLPCFVWMPAFGGPPGCPAPPPQVAQNISPFTVPEKKQELAGKDKKNKKEPKDKHYEECGSSLEDLPG